MARNRGFLLKTTLIGTLTVANPAWNSSTTSTPSMGPHMCSPVKVAGPTDMVQLCATTSVVDLYSGDGIYGFGDVGTTNVIGLHYITPPVVTGLVGDGCPNTKLGVGQVGACQILACGDPGDRYLDHLLYAGNFARPRLCWTNAYTCDSDDGERQSGRDGAPVHSQWLGALCGLYLFVQAGK